MWNDTNVVLQHHELQHHELQHPDLQLLDSLDLNFYSKFGAVGIVKTEFADSSSYLGTYALNNREYLIWKSKQSNGAKTIIFYNKTIGHLFFVPDVLR